MKIKLIVGVVIVLAIIILGNLLPLHMNPLRVAEEYAMLDNMSDGRLIAGFAPGSGPETFNYDVPSASSPVSLRPLTNCTTAT
mgnify:CR=1 FL=1